MKHIKSISIRTFSSPANIKDLAIILREFGKDEIIINGENAGGDYSTSVHAKLVDITECETEHAIMETEQSRNFKVGTPSQKYHIRIPYRQLKPETDRNTTYKQILYRRQER